MCMINEIDTNKCPKKSELDQQNSIPCPCVIDRVAKGPLDAATLEHMADGTSERDVPAGEVVAAQDALATEVRIGDGARSSTATSNIGVYRFCLGGFLRTGLGALSNVRTWHIMFFSSSTTCCCTCQYIFFACRG